MFPARGASKDRIFFIYVHVSILLLNIVVFVSYLRFNLTFDTYLNNFRLRCNTQYFITMPDIFTISISRQ